LDAKPNSALVVPTTINDLQALLNNNARFNFNQPIEGELSTDDYFLTQDGYNAIQPLEQNSYIWAVDVFNGNPAVADWDFPYENILLTNLALEGAAKITDTVTNVSALNNLKGTAYFYRGWEFFLLAQEFSPQYDSSTASTDLGIPLKLGSDVNEKATRSTNQQTYAQIISDLKNSIPLLPATPYNNSAYNPGRSASFGMLARVYLSMNDYADCLVNVDSCLAINSTLLNFAQLDSANTFPMPYPNAELFFDYGIGTYYGLNFLSYTDSTLYKSFGVNDLRTKLYFNPFDGTGYMFRGYYAPYNTTQGGLCTDEMILTKAECEARLGQTTNALNDLNNLLITRWVPNTYIPYTASNALDALKIILLERRKELMYRGTRWLDLRRLNKDAQFEITLTRNINNQVYTLPPNDQRYVFPIPQDELLYNPIQQNPR
jgi:hypothetical protein